MAAKGGRGRVVLEAGAKAAKAIAAAAKAKADAAEAAAAAAITEADAAEAERAEEGLAEEEAQDTTLEIDHPL